MAFNPLLAILAVPAIVCAAVSPHAGRNDTTRIVGGYVAQKNEFPYAVSIQTHDRSDTCSGSLLDGTTVLTAAHCLVGKTASDLFIRAGSLRLGSGGYIANATSIVVHPRYNDAALTSDVGIIKLSEPIAKGNSVGYALLAPKGSDPDVGTIITVAGWGHDTAYSYILSTVLRAVDISTISQSKCAEQLSKASNPDVTQTVFCASGMDDDKVQTPCGGDSGGPAIDTETGLLIGVTSWGSAFCDVGGFPSGYARVGSLRGFIDEHMSASDRL